MCITQGLKSHERLVRLLCDVYIYDLYVSREGLTPSNQDPGDVCGLGDYEFRKCILPCHVSLGTLGQTPKVVGTYLLSMSAKSHRCLKLGTYTLVVYVSYYT